MDTNQLAEPTIESKKEEIKAIRQNIKKNLSDNPDQTLVEIDKILALAKQIGDQREMRPERIGRRSEKLQIRDEPREDLAPRQSFSGDAHLDDDAEEGKHDDRHQRFE